MQVLPGSKAQPYGWNASNVPAAARARYRVPDHVGARHPVVDHHWRDRLRGVVAMVKALAPVELLHSIKRVLAREAADMRTKEAAASEHAKPALAARARSDESIVVQIDATLRDWG